MKKQIFILIISFLFGIGLNAQTLSTDVVAAPSVGTSVDVPIYTNSIPDVLSLTIYLEYNNTVLSYTSFTDNIGFSSIAVTAQSSSVLKILISGPFPAGTSIPDGNVVDVHFDYLGGFSDIKFHTTTYGTWASTYTELPPNFTVFNFTNADVTNGSVNGTYYSTTIDGGDWNTSTDWTAGVIPNSWANVTVASGTEVTTSGNATANNVTIETGGKLTLSNTLTATGIFLIESASGSNGSFINNGTLSAGTTSVQSYVTAGQWHGISSPVTGLTANDLYLGGSPDVWLKSYNESNDTYTSITELSQSLGNMEGWMTWIASGNQTYTFTGDFRSGPVSRSVTHSGNGFNFVGNPYTSAIDWDAGTGWTKTNVNDAIYIYASAGPTWATYIGGVGTNGGTQNIAMNQGFFVQSSAAGSLAMTTGVCVHSSVGFMKTREVGQIIRLQLTDTGLTDETVIRFIDGATTDFDGSLDAHKFFSFNTDYPQIFSTSNDFMSINSLPEANEAIGLDVTGADGNSMTISVTEALDFDNLYLKDELTGQVTNLKVEDYTFTYDADISNRFNLFFSITDVNERPESDIMIFAYDKNIQINLEGLNQANISVYNLLGQEIASVNANSNQVLIPISNSGYYFVKVANGNRVSTQKVFIK